MPRDEWTFQFDDNIILTHRQCRKIIAQKVRGVIPDGTWLILCKVNPDLEAMGSLGRFYNLRVDFRRPGSLDQRFLSFFIKIPAVKQTAEFLTLRDFGFFDREIFLYKRIFPKIFKESYDEILPKCFHVAKDMLVLDDMKSYNYKNLSDTDPLDFDHCQTVMETLARFHVKSAIWEESEMPLIDVCYSYNFELHSTDNQLQISLNFLAAELVNVLIWIPEFQNLKTQCFQTKFLKLASEHYDKLLETRSDTLRVLCHCDLRISNILFLYDSQKKPIQSCLVDFQCTRYTSPAYDILFFLYTNTTKETRELYLLRLSQIYFQTFCGNLEQENLDPTIILPGHKFADSLDEFKVQALVHAIAYRYTLLRQIIGVSRSLKDLIIWEKFWMNIPLMYTPIWHKLFLIRNRLVHLFLELYDIIMP